MKLVVDTNILFSYFRESSFTHKMLSKSSIEFYSPAYVFAELDRYKSEVQKKAKITALQYTRLKKLLARCVKIVGKNKYGELLGKAKKVCPDPKDVDFFALALYLDCPIWSQDKELQKQKDILVVTTADVCDEFFK